MQLAKIEMKPFELDVFSSLTKQQSSNLQGFDFQILNEESKVKINERIELYI